MKRIAFLLIVLAMLGVSHCSDYHYPTGSRGYLAEYRSSDWLSEIGQEQELTKLVEQALEEKGLKKEDLSDMQTQIYELQIQVYALQTEVSKLKTNVNALKFKNSLP